jgi:putative ABC transport system ATP-binding protein
MQDVIVARDIHKSFGSGSNCAVILRGITLSITRGETVFLVGPSGSGKTTLLSILGCILSPDKGEVEVLGRAIAGLPPEQRAEFRRQHLGFVFQNLYLFPTLSALDNVRMALCIREQSAREASARALNLLEEVGLRARAGLRPGQLSTGECQRVAVARALAGDPAILFADEPTAALDAENGQAIMQLLARLVRERGSTLAVVTHDARIISFADRIITLEDGRLKNSVDPEWRQEDCRSRAHRSPAAAIALGHAAVELAGEE